MDIRKVKKLMELLEQSGMAEIEIKEGEESVKISRFGNMPLMTPTISQQPVPAIATPSNVLNLSFAYFKFTTQGKTFSEIYCIFICKSIEVILA